MIESIPDILTEELSRLQDEIIENHEKEGQVVTGKTRKSFSHYLVSDNRGILEGAAYVGVLERGRGSARRSGGGGSSNFLDNLKEWIRVRWNDVKGEEDLERKAKFLKWYLNKFGSKNYREGKHIDIFTKSIDNFIDRVTSRVGQHFETRVKNRKKKII